MTLGADLHPNFWDHESARQIERQSIREWIESVADEYLDERVLDYGCGKQPYRDIVEAAGGDYHPYDRLEFPGNVSGEDIGDDDPLAIYRWDAILVNQVIQYTRDPVWFLARLRAGLAPNGHLVMTYPTNWPEVEPDDLWRFTMTGMEHMLALNGYGRLVRHDRRAEIDLGGFRLPLGYGVVAQT